MAKGKHLLTSIHDPSNVDPEYGRNSGEVKKARVTKRSGKYTLADILASEDDNVIPGAAADPPPSPRRKKSPTLSLKKSSAPSLKLPSALYTKSSPGLSPKHTPQPDEDKSLNKGGESSQPLPKRLKTDSPELEVLNKNTTPQPSCNDSDEEMMDIDNPEFISQINTVLSENRESRASLLASSDSKSWPSIPSPPLPQATDYRSVKVHAGLVLDTNFLISNLSLIKNLQEVADTYGYIIVLPWVVIQELDGLKSLRRKTSTTHDGIKVPIATLARKATDWIYTALAQLDHRVVGQKLTEVCSAQTSSLHGDDGILDCCQYFLQEKQLLTVILSNDRNLCNKALIHDIKTVSYVKGLTAKAIGEVIQNETLIWTKHFDSDEEMTMDYEEEEEEVSNGDSEQTDLAALKIQLAETEKDSMTNLRDFIVNVFVKEVGQSVLACLAVEFSEPIEYDRYVRGQETRLNNLPQLCKVINTFKLTVFADYFKRRIVFVNNPELDTPPEPEVKDIIRFVNSWGGVWMDLRKNGPRSLQYVQSVIDIMISSLTSRQQH